MSIRTKISLLVVPLVLLPLCIVGFHSYHSLARGFQEQSHLADQQLSLTVSVKIEQLLDECHGGLLQMSSILSNRLRLSREKSLEAVMYHSENPIEEIASVLTLRFSPLLTIRIIAPDGRVLFNAKSGKGTFEPGSALDEEIFFQSVSVSGQFPPVKKESDDPWITTFSNSIVIDQTLLGLVYFDLDMDVLGKVLRDMAATRPGYYFLFDGSGTILAEAGTIPILDTFPRNEIGQASMRFVSEEQPHAFSRYPERIGDRRVSFGVRPVREYISFINPIPQERWYLGVAHIDTPLLAAFRQSTILFWVVLGAGLIIALFGTIYISDAITTPIRRLTHATRDFARGNLHSRVDVGGSDEIGRLTIDFNTMASEIEELIKERQANEAVIAIGRFSMALAHDLRNPVEGMKLLAGELKRRLGTAQPEGEIADAIAQSVENLSSFIKHSLDFARLTEPKIESVNIAELADEIIQGFRFDDILLKKEYSHDLPAIEVDTVQIKRVMSNLIANACDACRQKISSSGSRILLKIAGLPDRVRIEVEDNGIGIQSEALDRIFEPFYSTKPEGHGLGLSLVRRIVSNHGGTITVRSTLHEGTLFSVELPIKFKCKKYNNLH